MGFGSDTTQDHPRRLYTESLDAQKRKSSRCDERGAVCPEKRGSRGSKLRTRPDYREAVPASQALAKTDGKPQLQTDERPFSARRRQSTRSNTRSARWRQMASIIDRRARRPAHLRQLRLRLRARRGRRSAGASGGDRAPLRWPTRRAPGRGRMWRAAKAPRVVVCGVEFFRKRRRLAAGSSFGKCQEHLKLSRCRRTAQIDPKRWSIGCATWLPGVRARHIGGRALFECRATSFSTARTEPVDTRFRTCPER
jgi:hypothetical protein